MLNSVTLSRLPDGKSLLDLLVRISNWRAGEKWDEIIAVSFNAHNKEAEDTKDQKSWNPDGYAAQLGQFKKESLNKVPAKKDLEFKELCKLPLVIEVTHYYEKLESRGRIGRTDPFVFQNKKWVLGTQTPVSGFIIEGIPKTG